jgi:predicted dehydrogenase
MTAQPTALPTFKNLAPHERIEKSLSVALVGYGRQGEMIVDALIRIPGVHVAAIADIWPWRRELAKNRLRSQRILARVYETVEELLDAEGAAIDAVIVATPDWQHVNHVSACLKANKHVYCDGEISDNSTKAQELVKQANEKKLFVQCGHQRRSNPQYIFAIENLLQQYKISTVCTHAYTQWHRGITPLLRVQDRFAMSTADLQRHGYESMEQLMNWEWFSRFGLGDVAYRTGQKLDLLRWFWDAEPVSVTSLGSNDYYNREALDFLMSIFTFKLPTGEIRRGYVQVLSTNASGGDIDKIGVEYLTVSTSEDPAQVHILSIGPTRTDLIRDKEVYNRFTRAIEEGFFTCHKIETPAEYKKPTDWRVEEPDFKKLDLPCQTHKNSLQPHLENFISAIRDGTKLRDPIEQASKNLIALEAAVQSAHERRTIDLPVKALL